MPIITIIIDTLTINLNGFRPIREAALICGGGAEGDGGRLGKFEITRIRVG